MLGNYLLRDKIGGFTDDALFKGMQTPGAYPHIDTDVYKRRTPFTKIMKPLKEDP